MISIVILLFDYVNISLCESILQSNFPKIPILILYDSFYKIPHQNPSFIYQPIPYRYHSHSGIWYSSIQQHINPLNSHHLFCIEYKKPENLLSLKDVLPIFIKQMNYPKMKDTIFYQNSIFYYKTFFLYPSELFFKYKFYQNEKMNRLYFSQRVYVKMERNTINIENQQIILNTFNKDYDELILKESYYEKETTIIYEVEEEIFFDIDSIYHLLSLPIYNKDIVMILNKKCKKKNQILEMIKPVLEENENVYVFVDYPLMMENELINEILLFLQKKENILFFHPLRGLKRMIEDKNENYIYYESMNYMKLRMFSKAFMSYQLYHQEMMDLKKSMKLKMKLYLQEIERNEMRGFECRKRGRGEEEIVVYVIHLKERYDRLGYIDEELKKEGFDVYQIWDGVKIREEEKGIVNPDLLMKKETSYIYACAGCKMAHLTLLKKIKKENQNKIYMIVEDDFVWKKIPNLKMKECIQKMIEEVKEKDEEWTILYVAMSQSKKKEKKKNVDVILCEEGEGLSTVAYIVNPKKIDEIIKVIEENGEEIDVVYQRYLQSRYRIVPNLGYQRKGWSDILGEWTNYEYQYEF